MYSPSGITSWLYNTYSSAPPTPPPDSPPVNEDSRSISLKRKRRTLSLPMDAPASSAPHVNKAKRQRVDDTDDVQPEQSVSQLGHDDRLSLTKTNTFDPPTSRSSGVQRSSSPTRETAVLLKSAVPPVLTENLDGSRDLPEQVELLGDRLAEGVDTGFIPNGLQDIIKNDPDLGRQSIRSADFDSQEPQPSEELSAIWKQTKRIFLKARACKENSKDENAWCDNVVRPLLELSIRLYGKEKWEVENVQSQSINPRYLSTIPAPTLLDPTRRKTIDRKTDYCFSYSLHDPPASLLYERLGARREIGHTLDSFTKRNALFSGIEVKAASGDQTEAEQQISIWMAASLQKKLELVQAASLQTRLESSALTEPAFTIVGHAHSIYYAYPQANLVGGKHSVHVLGPDTDRFGKLGTNSIRGIFRLARVYRNLLEYGSDEGEHGYWGQFLGPVLHKLSSK